jgi:hypothetical protein
VWLFTRSSENLKPSLDMVRPGMALGGAWRRVPLGCPPKGVHHFVSRGLVCWSAKLLVEVPDFGFLASTFHSAN